MDSKGAILTQRLQYNRRILRGILSTEVDCHHGPRRELRVSSHGTGGSIRCWCSDNAGLGKEMAACLPGTSDSRELSVLPCLTCHPVARLLVHRFMSHYDSHAIPRVQIPHSQIQFCFTTSESCAPID